MPLNPKDSVGENIAELHAGKTYARTAAKFGKKRADRQAIAIAMHVSSPTIAGAQRKARRK